jgi:hypothetical protein
MTPSVLRALLCGAFEISQDEDALLVRTPFGLDYNDDLVIRVRPDNGAFRVDDNGDTLFALTISGAVPDAERVSELAPDVEYDQDDGSLILRPETEDSIASAVFSVAGAALRIHGACRPRQRAVATDFRERVISALEDVARETGVLCRIDEVVEEAGSLTADVVLGDANPLLVIAANSVERLMEAELIFLRRKLGQVPGFVCAAVPSAKAIGQKHYSRANYYTDKALEFDGWDSAFRDFARQRVSVQ